VGAVALGSFVQRHVPEVRLGEGVAPVSRIVEATGQNTGARPGLGAQAVETIQASLASPMGGLSLSPQIRPEAELHFDLAIDRTAEGVTVGYVVRRSPIVVGAPVAFDVPAVRPESPFIKRFGSLLVVLRDPGPVLDQELLADD
jgi:hypothetical protein